MKKIMIVLSLMLMVFISGVSYSQGKRTEDLKGLDKQEVLNVRNKLAENAKMLSLLSEDIKQLYTSMSASQSEGRFLIIRCRKNIANIKGIYRYVVDALDKLLLIRKKKIPYYSYLQEYGLEEMGRLQDQYINNIQTMYSQISSKPALHLIDEAAKTIHSSSKLLNKAIETIQQHSKQREAANEKE